MQLGPYMVEILALGSFPVCVYLLYNWAYTGNPIYPYYNTIFQSTYFPLSDFKDHRWGPASVKEILLWPYYMLRYPDYKMSELPIWYVKDLAAGYLAIPGILWQAPF